MIAILLCLFAAPPELPEELDCSPSRVRQWCREEGLADAERERVKLISAAWVESHNKWVKQQEPAVDEVIQAMLACEPASVEQQAAVDVLRQLEWRRTVRWKMLVKKVRRLVELRGEWPVKAA